MNHRQAIKRTIMNVEEVIKRIVKTMRVRDEKEGKQYGVIVVAEGLAEYLADGLLERHPARRTRHISVSQVNLNRLFASLVADEYKKQTGQERRVIGLQLGYEARCAKPHAFDVMLGSQLGVGRLPRPGRTAARRRDGFGRRPAQSDLSQVRRSGRSETLVTTRRYIDLDSDFHKLARFLETDVND